MNHNNMNHKVYFIPAIFDYYRDRDESILDGMEDWQRYINSLALGCRVVRGLDYYVITDDKQFVVTCLRLGINAREALEQADPLMFRGNLL